MTDTQTPDGFRTARHKIGLSQNNLARLFMLGKHGGRTVRRWEAGDVPISGPASLLVRWLAYGKKPILPDT